MSCTAVAFTSAAITLACAGIAGLALLVWEDQARPYGPDPRSPRLRPVRTVPLTEGKETL